jgi:ATP-dependent DNA ligase
MAPLISCAGNGIASFDRICQRHHDGDVFPYAFDLIELNGGDLRRGPLGRFRFEAQGSPYRSGRSPNWLKMKDPACAAATREAEEDRAR